MNANELFLLALDPSQILRVQGMEPDSWQRRFLLCQAPHVLLNCCRGAGKTRVTSVLALHTALFTPGALVLLVSRAQRQAGELLRYVKQGDAALGSPVARRRDSAHVLEFANGSRILSLPGKEETIRGFQGVALLVLDEAARVPDDLFASVAPMVGVSRGRTVCLSTPFGQRGFFWREWCRQDSSWLRFRVPWQDCPRLSPEFIAEEERRFGKSWVAQEYGCSFEALEGLVYPDFDLCRTDAVGPPAERDRRVGGIDFGFRNPFAAVWGFLDRDDVLHVHHERYLRATPLHEHATALPRGYLWYADPAGRTEIEELRAAGHKVRRGNNDVRLGIAAVTARVRTARLKVSTAGCPHLLTETRLYRYAGEGEAPVDEHNHALAALRYLVCSLDARFLARLRRQGNRGGPEPEEADDRRATTGKSARRRGPSLDDPNLW